MIRTRGTPSHRALPASVGAAVTVAALLAFAVPTASAANGAGLGVLLPDPGQVSFAVASAKVRAGKPSQLPDAVRLGFPKAKKLPDSIRVVWATRAIRKPKRVTYAAAILIVNQASAAKAGERRAAARIAKPAGDFISLLWDMFVTDASVCNGCNELFPGDQLNSLFQCDSCSKHRVSMHANSHVDAGSSKAQREELHDLFKEAGRDTGLVFETAGAQSALETGHYDDGHAFGWQVKSKRDERELLNAVATGIVDGEPGELIDRIEMVAGVDLDGDGAAGSSGSGTFTRSEICEFNPDPPNCHYLDVTVSFTSAYRAFEIAVPGYFAEAGQDTGLYNASGGQIGACGPATAQTVYCAAENTLEPDTQVSTMIATKSGPSSDQDARLPDGGGGSLFMVTPAPNSKRLHGPFPIVGP